MGADAIVVSLVRTAAAGEWHLVVYKYKPASGELKQVTNGKSDFGAVCTPDGKNLFYRTGEDVGHLMRIPSDGGTPVEMASNVTTFPRVSPDGKQLIYLQTVGQGQQSKEPVCGAGRRGRRTAQGAAGIGIGERRGLVTGRAGACVYRRIRGRSQSVFPAADRSHTVATHAFRHRTHECRRGCILAGREESSSNAGTRQQLRRGDVQQFPLGLSLASYRGAYWMALRFYPIAAFRAMC